MTESANGYIDAAPFSPRQAVHVTGGSEEAPTLRGYDVHGDLARYYDPAEVALLAATGELPSESQLRMYRVALTLCSPVSAADGCGRASILSWLTSGGPSAALQVGAVSLLARAKSQFDKHEQFWVELSEPQAVNSADAADTAFGRSPASWIKHQFGAGCPGLTRASCKFEAVLALLHAAGLRTESQVLAVLCSAALPALAAEAAAGARLGFVGQPGSTPRFEYSEASDELGRTDG